MQEVVDNPFVTPFLQEFDEEYVRDTVRAMERASVLTKYGEARGTMYRINQAGRKLLDE